MTARRLSEITVSGTPSESNPIDLDLFDASGGGPLADGDDITLLLTDIALAYSNSIYVRAPSRTVSVTCDTILWSIANFYFLEDESPANRLTITHLPSYADSATGDINGSTVTKKPVLWRFRTFTNVKVGGPNLSMTFVGTHYGIQNRDYLSATGAGSDPKAVENIGFIDLHMPTSASPDLFDWRANIKSTHRYAIYSWNGYVVDNSVTFGGNSYRIKQCNVAGLFWSTMGIFFHQGARDVWFDPDRTVISDPYVRCGVGWQGDVTSSPTLDGYTRKVGTNTSYTGSEAWYRTSGGAAYSADSINGGVTFEYGWQNWVQRFPGNIGTSGQPFILRLKDWGVSGPGTGHDPGVTASAPIQTILFKGDPAQAYGNTVPFRFVHWKRLTPTYGDGLYSNGDNLVRVEANDFSGILNFGYDVKFTGNWDTNFYRGQLFLFEYSTDTSCRTSNHVLRAPAGTSITDTITMVDTDTVTGPGAYANLVTATATNCTARDNAVNNCTVTGTIACGASTGTTTIDNVVFTGSARAVITIGSGSTAVVTNLTVPNGSTITGAGTLTYEGSGRTLPYTIPDSTSNATLTSNGTPNPPSGGSVT